ncbi:MULTISPECIES: ABC transporter permease [Ruegeria]|uniref:Peptide/nickel transport system permease protein n=1 Tax=Ruegeria faecimaris TaxID=686389 RepID=A0A521EJH4_9RHOB|nr:MULTISPECIES: ABC transporter permease [Ruegeria]SMO84054.1 peptide/nickel transport system permease protein [Ruegeria faecimaris]
MSEATDIPTPRASVFAGLRLTWTAGIAGAVLLFWLILAFFGPWIAPHGEAEIISGQTFAPIGEGGLLGTDKLGRDVLSRLIYGVRTTLLLALVTTMISFLFGVALGFAAAILRGWFDIVVSRVVEAFMAFPSTLLALVVIGAFGTSITVLVLTVGLVLSTSVFRVSRALGYDIGVMDFVEAARARGEGTWWILTREILPNSMAPLIAEFGLRFTFSILFLSGLSFLGLGVQEPAADWGLMVQENVGGLFLGSSAALIPAACIASLTVSMNLLVDWFQQRQQGETVLEKIDQ